MRNLILIMSLIIVGCATQQQSPNISCDTTRSHEIAIIASPRPCICPKGFDCGDCCGPNHCMCNPN